MGGSLARMVVVVVVVTCEKGKEGKGRAWEMGGCGAGLGPVGKEKRQKLWARCCDCELRGCISVSVCVCPDETRACCPILHNDVEVSKCEASIVRRGEFDVRQVRP